jgi:hypothetical protein
MIRIGIRPATTESMPVSLRFRCQFCDDRPDPLTQVSLVAAMRQATLGEHQDALPGRWLIFHARGLFGPPRYACEAHRGDLVAYLREHYGTVGPQVWRRPPYPSSSLAHSDMDNAWNIATRRRTGGP